jgi:hypothetical protein
MLVFGSKNSRRYFAKEDNQKEGLTSVGENDIGNDNKSTSLNENELNKPVKINESNEQSSNL